VVKQRPLTAITGHSLSRSLLLWFLLLALLPLTLTAWLAHRQVVDGLHIIVAQELKHDALDSARSVQNWIDFRFMELNSQADNRYNIKFLIALKEDFKASRKSLAEYIKSDAWAFTVASKRQDLDSFYQNYDYIYDLFLIDSDGNILFTVENKSDLGTNLFNGLYAQTRFAQSVRISLEKGTPNFSDLERYAPLNNQITGFLTTPLLDKQGNKIGVFAIQIKLERINNLMDDLHLESTLTHYLVGEDRLLRTPLSNVAEEGVLSKRIETEQVEKWLLEQGEAGYHADYKHENVIAYQGPRGQQVFGFHQSVNFAGKKWALISEIEKDEALAVAYNLGRLTLMMCLLTGALAVAVGGYQARRITQPIIQLANASMAAAAGEIDQQVSVKANNEIGVLVDAFNHMLMMRQTHELTIEESHEQTQQALMELAEQKFALDQHAIVAITDVQGTIIFVNDKFSEISGYSREELLNQNHRLLNSRYHDTEFFRDMYRTIAGGKVWHGEVCNRAKEGHLYWVDTTVVPFMDNNEKPKNYIAIRTDITERKLTEQALEKSNRETKKALAELAKQKFALDQHAIVAVTDVQGTITFVNDKFSEISGYNRDELLGKNHRLLNSGFHESTFFHDMFQTIARGKVWHGEICNKAKAGHLYWVDTTIVPFMSEDGKAESYIAIRADITERKQAELELLVAKEAAETATQQKSDFLANMSHEIRTPMNGIIGMTGLLLDTTLNAKQLSYAKATLNSADALLTIINDILDFSKIEAGKLELEEVPFDLQTLVEDVAEFMALRCREKGVEMLLRYKPGTERSVTGDPGRVRQILLNLLSNAIKFTEQGYILLEVKSIEDNDGIVSFNVAVEDSGIGIAEDKLGHVFNKFDQEDSSTTRKYGGTGLGLAICRQLCNLMHGDISVKSQKGKGSIFSFIMKLRRSNEVLPVCAKHDKYEQLKELKTLIVDDSEIARSILLEQLSVLQMRLSCASSGSEAIEALKQSNVENDPFDIVITDNVMPEMDGEMLVKEIFQLDINPNPAMIFVTSALYKNDATRLKAMGFNGYLTKPIFPSEVSQILSLIWEAKQQSRDIPLVTRYTLQETNSGTRKKSIFIDTQILLAEDNPINIIVATELLEGFGCIITPAGNGIEALASVKERNFDLIFMDCQMPEMDGFEATQEIRKLQKNTDEHTPIIALTANAMKSDKEKCLDVGMDDYISKPVSQKMLESALVKWLPHKLKISNKNSIDKDEKIETEIQQNEISAADSAILNLDTFNTLKKLFGDRFSSVVEQHTNNSSENVNCVEQALQQDDLETLERVAHSLKGASAQFGAIRLNRLAAEIEVLAKNGALDSIRLKYDELRFAQEQVANVMSNLLDGSS